MSPVVFSARVELLAALVVLVVALVALLWARTLTGPCSAPGCTSRAWWRVYLVIRGDDGAIPDPLVRLPTPTRVCGRCRPALAKGDPRPSKLDRQAIARGLARVQRERPNWDRTQIDFEHVVAAHLRGL
jgi:hypothetical protein